VECALPAFAGSAVEEINLIVMRQTLEAVRGTVAEPGQNTPLAAVTMLAQLAPRDEPEGMIMSQMIATHFSAMASFAVDPEAVAVDRQIRHAEATDTVRALIGLLDGLMTYRKGIGE
jgi:hypothetical protein